MWVDVLMRWRLFATTLAHGAREGAEVTKTKAECQRHDIEWLLFIPSVAAVYAPR